MGQCNGLGINRCIIYKLVSGPIRLSIGGCAIVLALNGKSAACTCQSIKEYGVVQGRRNAV